MKTTSRILFCLLVSLAAPFGVAEEPVAVEAEVTFTQAELDQMLAPVALYPDTVLSHLLIAATYPLEVVQAERWASSHTDISGKEALDAVEGEDWDPSVKALVPFPNLLSQMSEDLGWTQRLGEAFLQDEERVLDTVQKLRQRAYKEGNLDTMDHVEVNRDGDNIVIESKVREVVYVPYYDTRVVYGPWWWDAYPPVYWPYRGYHYSSGFVVWGPRVYIGTGIYFSSFHWHRRHVVVVDHHHHHRFRSSRHVAHYHGAHRWEHNPVHRRGVVYRSVRARDRYGDHHRYSADVSSRNNRGVVSRSLSDRDRDHARRITPDNAETHSRREAVLRNLRDGSADRVERTGIDRSREIDNNRAANIERRSNDGAMSEAIRRREAREAAGVRSERQIAPERREYRTQQQGGSDRHRSHIGSDRSDRSNSGVMHDAVRERRQSQSIDRSSSRDQRSMNAYQRPERSSRMPDRSVHRSRDSSSHRARASSRGSRDIR